MVEDAPYVNDGTDLNGPRADEAARQELIPVADFEASLRNVNYDPNA